MISNVSLDVFIGLVFIYLLYSLLATTLQEIIASKLGFRAKVLEKAVLRMLEDGKSSTRLPYLDRLQSVAHLLGFKNLMRGKKIVPWFYAHPLMKYLAEDNFFSKPAYITASNFSKVIIDLLKGFSTPESEAVKTINDSIQAGQMYKLPLELNTGATDRAHPAIKVLLNDVENLDSTRQELMLQTVPLSTDTRLFLLSLWKESGADIGVFRTRLESWFDDTMERASGWYRRYTRLLCFVIGLLFAVLFNIDTIAICRILSKDNKAREQLVQMAIRDHEKYAGEVERIRNGTPAEGSKLDETYRQVSNDAELATNTLGLGRNWTDSCKACDSAETPRSRKISDLKNRLATVDSLNLVVYTHQEKLRLSIFGSDSVAAALAVKKELLAAETQLRSYQPEKIKNEYERQLAVEQRCQLMSAKKGTWFVYHPLQGGGFETLLGWMITAWAITLGAPFWFDLLTKLLRSRSSRTNTTTPDNDAPARGTAGASTTTPVIQVNTGSGSEAVG